MCVLKLKNAFINYHYNVPLPFLSADVSEYICHSHYPILLENIISNHFNEKAKNRFGSTPILWRVRFLGSGQGS